MNAQHGLKGVIARVLQLRIVRAYLSYSEHKGSMLADSVTYRALFGIFAGVLLGFSIAALWLGNNPDAMAALGNALESVLPGFSDIVDLDRIQTRTVFSISGIASLIGLVAAAIGAVGSLRTAINELGDQLHQREFFLWVYVRDLLVAAGFGALLALAAVLGTASSFGITQVTEWLGLSIAGGVMGWVTQFASLVVVFLIDALAIAFVFRVLSHVRAPAKALWAGATFGAVGLVVLQTLSGLFVRGATSNPLLATFAALIALLLWVNLSVQVVLIASSYILTATAEFHDRVREKFGARTFAERRVKRAEDLVMAATRELRAAREAEQDTGDASESNPGRLR